MPKVTKQCMDGKITIITIATMECLLSEYAKLPPMIPFMCEQM